MNKYTFLFIVILFLLEENLYAQNRVVLDSVTVVGRHSRVGDSLTVYWPGSSYRIKFNGQHLNLKFSVARPVWVIIFRNGVFQQDVKLTQQSGMVNINQSGGWHEYEIYRRSEIDSGPLSLLTMESDGVVRRGNLSSRLIEFIGDSITAGYAVEDQSGKDRPDSTKSNPYLAYGAMSARLLKAESNLTVKSGIGIMLSWFPETMPAIYDRLNPLDSSSRYSFIQKPAVIVLNLFQNDSWLVKMPDYPTHKAAFGTKPPDEARIVSSYCDFLLKIRRSNPGVPIVCTLASMDAAKSGSEWPGYIQKSILKLKDPQISYFPLPYIPRNGHPTKADQELLANKLAAFLKEKLNW